MCDGCCCRRRLKDGNWKEEREYCASTALESGKLTYKRGGAREIAIARGVWIWYWTCDTR